MTELGEIILGTIGLIVAMYLYFLPSFMAHGRYHPNENSIFVLNLFLGWTFLGWVAALIWAFSAVPQAMPANVPSRRLRRRRISG